MGNGAKKIEDPSSDGWPSSSPSMRNRRLTTSEHVYTQLKEAIASAQFHPGAPLVIRDLAENF